MTFTPYATYFGLCIAISMAAANNADSAASGWISTDFSQVRMITSRDSVAGNTELDVGIQVRLESGWKTYWRHPGNAGIPIEFDWAASEKCCADKAVVACSETPVVRRIGFIRLRGRGRLSGSHQGAGRRCRGAGPPSSELRGLQRHLRATRGKPDPRRARDRLSAPARCRYPSCAHRAGTETGSRPWKTRI